jgi:hypothetical protein
LLLFSQNFDCQDAIAPAQVWARSPLNGSATTQGATGEDKAGNQGHLSLRTNNSARTGTETQVSHGMNSMSTSTLFQHKMSLKGRSCGVVNIRMDDAEKLSLEAIGRFVAASEEIRFEAKNHQQLYSWVERVLVQQEYAQQGKAARGLVRRYLPWKCTAASMAKS